jgi:hypothetical protein
VFKPQLQEAERRRRLERFNAAVPRAGLWREDDRLEARHVRDHVSLSAALTWLAIGVCVGVAVMIYTVERWHPMLKH